MYQAHVYDIACFAGYTHCVENLKSLIIATCLMNRQISVDEAVYCSRLELEYQVSVTSDLSLNIR